MGLLLMGRDYGVFQAHFIISSTGPYTALLFAADVGRFEIEFLGTNLFRHQ